MPGLTEESELGEMRRREGQRAGHHAGRLAQRCPGSVWASPRPQAQRLASQASHVGVTVVHGERERSAEHVHRLAEAEGIQLKGTVGKEQAAGRGDGVRVCEERAESELRRVGHGARWNGEGDAVPVNQLPALEWTQRHRAVGQRDHRGDGSELHLLSIPAQHGHVGDGRARCDHAFYPQLVLERDRFPGLDFALPTQ